jgi:hypothetical protein
MMNVSASDARAMDLWEYEARLYHWNKAHDPDGSVSPPDPEKTQSLIDKLNANPGLTTKTKQPA